MNAIEQVSSALYFSAAANAAGEAAKEAKKNARLKSAAKRSAFTTALKRHEEANELAASGLPPEIAGMSVEEAVVFLKDKVTMAGDALTGSFSSDAFAKYRLAVSQLMKYVVKHNFELEEHRRLPDKRTGKTKILVQIRVIDSKLSELASSILANQMDKLVLLKKIEEIQGLIVDMLAT